MIEMADSIIPENLPPYPAYLAYTDGHWPTAARVRAMFPTAHLLTLTVKGGGAKADGCDCETGDLTADEAAEWLHLSIIAGQWRPVLYASRDGVPPVLDVLGDAHVTRAQIRILSAHYGDGNHICSPAACGATFTADGTQWTDSAPGVGGTLIDLSTLNDDFFSAPAPIIPVEADVTLERLENGSAGQPVQNWQGLLVAHGLGYLIATGKGNVMQQAGIDGAFGAKTEAATKAFQAEAGLPQTGIVDAATWQKALG
jgi:peptidoglycan hydrolase-like protein with peptidoglycan-binding domain